MRLEQGQVLPPRAARLLKVCYALVLLIVLLGISAWVPGDEGRLWLARAVNVLVALYLWLLGGLYLAPLFGSPTGQGPEGHSAPGLGAALTVPLLLAAISPLMPPGVGAPVLLVAVLLYLLIEKLPSQAALWPVAWRTARRQQSQLLVVALASVAVAAWTAGQTY